MIIEARGDVVLLRGALNENHWDAIAAGVDLLLPEHPQGILMDCSGITCMTDMGGATFMSGLSYMEAHGARIILCSIPPVIAERLRSIPGLHSQVPTAPTLDVGRKSLEAAKASPLKARQNARVVLVPVNPPFSSHAARQLLSRLHLSPHTEIHLIYAMAVPRSLPVGAPLPEEENRADTILSEAEHELALALMERHVARGRNIPDTLVEAVNRLGAAELLIGLSASAEPDETLTRILDSLREKCPCTFTLTQEPARNPAQELKREPGREVSRDPGRELNREPVRETNREPNRVRG